MPVMHVLLSAFLLGSGNKVVRLLATVVHLLCGAIWVQERRGMDGVALSFCQTGIVYITSIGTFPRGEEVEGYEYDRQF